MRFWTAYALLALGFATKAFAEGHGGGHAAGAHHASVSDLIAPAVNVAILVGFLVWKLKGPLTKHFNTMAENVSNTLERASLKSKEAKIMLDNEERKIAGLTNEVKSINNQSENDVVTYEKNLSQEVEEKSHKLKIDANSKIQADKKAMVDALNAELLDQVVKKTKATIKGNNDYQNKVSTKLLQGL
jgi:F0F1-type ATP synthase membrane subunit b/b'